MIRFACEESRSSIWELLISGGRGKVWNSFPPSKARPPETQVAFFTGFSFPRVPNLKEGDLNVIQSYKLCKVLCAMLVIPALFGAAPALAATHSYITGGSNSCKSLAVIDTSTHTEIARIPMENAAAGTGGIPTELAITPDGARKGVVQGQRGELGRRGNAEAAASPRAE